MSMRLLCAGLALTVLLPGAAFARGSADPVTAAVAGPTVSGPLEGGKGRPFFPALVDPADYGYTETEYVLSGTARPYGTSGARRSFATRMLVYRPRDPRRFSGTAYLEWNNVTAQADVPVDFSWAYRHVFRSGDG